MHTQPGRTEDQKYYDAVADKAGLPHQQTRGHQHHEVTREEILSKEVARLNEEVQGLQRESANVKFALKRLFALYEDQAACLLDEVRRLCGK